MELLKKISAIVFSMFGAIVLITSCSFGRFLKTTATNVKFVYSSHAHENRFRTDGYYVCESDTCTGLYGICLFYPDGGFIGIPNSMIRYYQKETIDGLFKKHGYSEKKRRWNWEYGVYSLKNDTIVAHQYYPYYIFAKPFYFYWMMSRSKWVAVDDKTLMLCAYDDFVADKYHYSPSIRNVLTSPVRFRFVQSNIIPSSKMRYKKKKWMWERENDWLEYMKTKDNEKE
ncbi:MAG: hypothetical protein IKQ03_06005 [Prevotella sp.]|nr:hypothetical protein [Prevotella sp.]